MTKVSALYFVQGAFRHLLPAHGVIFVKYASILLQALNIQMDEDFTFALYELTKLQGVPWTDDEAAE